MITASVKDKEEVGIWLAERPIPPKEVEPEMLGTFNAPVEDVVYVGRLRSPDARSFRNPTPHHGDRIPEVSAIALVRGGTPFVVEKDIDLVYLDKKFEETLSDLKKAAGIAASVGIKFYPHTPRDSWSPLASKDGKYGKTTSFFKFLREDERHSCSQGGDNALLKSRWLLWLKKFFWLTTI